MLDSVRRVFGSRMFIAFIALSLVSLFADITYEGARSIIGAYLEYLEATAVVAGVVSMGDLIGYLMRGVGGFIAGFRRSSNVYWGLVFGGYVINLLAVPMLAFAGRWEYALALVFLERVGKGLRTPARDVILAEVTEGIGRGKGFGFHELMDQIGAVSGPLLVSWSLYASGGSFRWAFITLIIPAAIALFLLTIAYTSYPSIKAVRAHGLSISVHGLGRSFWLFTLGTALLSLGYVHWALVAYNIEHWGVMPAHNIAILYTVAMLVDAIVALPAGVLYDKYGPRTIIVTPILASIATPLILLRKPMYITMAVIVWGAVMGIYETIMRVVVADITSPEYRAYAYGIYGLVFGGSWTLGNIILAMLIQRTPRMVTLYVIIVEVLALVILAKMVSEWGKSIKR